MDSDKTQSDDRWLVGASTEVLQELGRINVYLSSLESIVLACMCQVMSRDIHEISCLAGGDDYKILVTKLEKLVHYRASDKVKADFLGVLSLLETINTKRNQYIHSLWYYKDDMVKRAKYLRNVNKDGTFRQAEIVSLEELRGLTQNLSTAIGTLVEMFDLPSAQIDIGIKVLPTT